MTTLYYFKHHRAVLYGQAIHQEPEDRSLEHLQVLDQDLLEVHLQES